MRRGKRNLGVGVEFVIEEAEKDGYTEESDESDYPHNEMEEIDALVAFDTAV